jgi:hypothetical protein
VKTIYHLIFIAAICCVCFGCHRAPPPPQTATPVANSADEAWKKSMSQQVLVLSNVTAKLARRLESDEIKDRIERDWTRSANINPDDKSYQRIDADVATLFVSTESVDPYLDGYKVKLKIGNPTTADFNGFTLTSFWGPTYTPNLTVEAYESAQKSRTNTCPNTLLSGYWTPVEIVLAPANADEIRNAKFSIKLNAIKLKETDTQ